MPAAQDLNIEAASAVRREVHEQEVETAGVLAIPRYKHLGTIAVESGREAPEALDKHFLRSECFPRRTKICVASTVPHSRSLPSPEALVPSTVEPMAPDYW